MESHYNKDLEQYFQTTGSPNVAFTCDDEDRVLSFIISIGSSFPSEISRKMMLRVEQVNAIVTKLINKEFLMRLNPDKLYPQPLIKCRISDMQGIGITGFEQFAIRSWVCATEDGILFIINKYKGEHRRANYAYVETYPDIELNANHKPKQNG